MFARFTWNIRDFDQTELDAHRVSISDPDQFLSKVFDRDPDVTLAATIKAFSFLKRPNGLPTWRGYVDLIERDGLPMFAKRLLSRTPNDISEEADEIGIPDIDNGTL